MEAGLKKAFMESPESSEKCLELANHYWQNFFFEETARTCLAYLHQHMKEATCSGGVNNQSNNMQIVFACGGSGSRWGEFMGHPKQLIDVGDRIPLIQRTINQFSRRLPGVAQYILIGEEQFTEFRGVKGCKLIYRTSPSDYSVGIEILLHQKQKILDNKNILWIFGDAFITNQAVDTICNVCKVSDSIKIFGRKYQNLRFRNNGGEIFGWFTPLLLAGELLEWHFLTEKIYKGTPLFRFKSWEVASLISWARRTGLRHASDIKSRGITPEDACRGIITTFSTRDFDPNIWVEINDATEDFDYPIEYLNRLRLLVENISLCDAL